MSVANMPEIYRAVVPMQTSSSDIPLLRTRMARSNGGDE